MDALLYAVSHFSILRGVHSPKRLCELACELGYKSIALVDRDNMYGLPEFLSACRYSGLRPVIASEISSLDQSLKVVLYANGDSGFSNLCRIISARHCEKDFDLFAAVKHDSAGLCALSNNPLIFKELASIMPVYYHIANLRRVPSWAKEKNYPCLVAPPMVFHFKQDYHTHQLMRAIDTNTTLDRLRENDCFMPDSFLLPVDEVKQRYAIFENALEDTARFVDTIRSRKDFGTPVMPRFKSDKPAVIQLRDKALQGAVNRYGEITPQVGERLEYELDLIGRKGFASYFLIVEDIVKQSPRTCGRGSGAASLVSYCLGITNVDPIRYNLMFERFINPGRKDPPDIDVDFAWDERDDVIDYVFRRYGKEHAAMVATHQTFGGRMALREAARVYGLTESEISAVSKKFPYVHVSDEDGPDILQVLRQHPKTRHIHLDSPWPEIISDAQRLLGKPRGIGTHCGGVVITPGPISHHAPVQISAKGVRVIQWEKDGTEDMGLVKIDLLGNRSLAVIRDAIQNIKAQGVNFDERKWDPASDKQTMNMLARGDTMGVFYIESPATRLLQKRSGRGDFDHLVIHSSIIRPAANRLINEYLRRLHGGKWTPEHPVLSKVLAETYGIMVYQEDVARVAMALAGFNFVEADALRKVMSKKDKFNKLESYRIKFIQGARRKGVSDGAVQKIWAMCRSFAGYSFCKPHSASYVQVSFQSAWLKAHYPACFMAGVLSNYGGFYSTQAYISEAQRLGITIEGPDINNSSDRYWASGMSIRVGLCQIKGLSAYARQNIIEKRSTGAYRNLDDFLGRCRLEEKDTERLIAAGACDSVEPDCTRPQLFWKMRCAYRRNAGENPPPLKQYSTRQLLSAQYRMLGFLTQRHPVTLMQNPVKQAVKIIDLKSYINRTVQFMGWCITSKTVSTRLGESMQFVTFEDETGLCESVLFPDAYLKFVHKIGWHEAFLVRGKVTRDRGALVVEVADIRELK